MRVSSPAVHFFFFKEKEKVVGEKREIELQGVDWRFMLCCSLVSSLILPIENIFDIDKLTNRIERRTDLLKFIFLF
jgi:hypothetical protein